MRIAVLLTGSLRTIRKTVRFLKINVLDANHYAGNTVHVFGGIRNDSNESNTMWETWFREQMGEDYQATRWITFEDPYWCTVRDNLLDQMPIDGGSKHYLRSGGSMFQYYQLLRAYEEMISKERSLRQTYDYVIRVRTDSIFCQPVDFQWLSWSKAEIAERYKEVQTCLKTDDAVRCVRHFMNTLLYPSKYDLSSVSEEQNFCIVSDADGLLQNVWASPEERLQDYLRKGRYILTCRGDILYIVRRDAFSFVPAIGTYYGHFWTPTMDTWWWNGETQFQSACHASGLTLYAYNTLFEDNSFNHYSDTTYFKNMTTMELKNLNMLYCLIRN